MNDTLLKNFFNKECSAEEAAQVYVYLKQHPEVVELYVNKEEWEALSNTTDVPAEMWDLLWQKIERKNRQRSTVFHLKKIAAAACIAGLLGITYYRLIADIHQPAPKPAYRPLLVQHRSVINTIRNYLRFNLPDGSVIRLSPASAVSFDVPFQNNKRNIQLSGEAWFKVAKDTAKPFTVFSGSLATTAVGTEFMVSGKEGNVVVKLFEGKVKIKSVQPAVQQKEVVLLPGQQLRFIASGNLLTVDKILTDAAKARSVKTAAVHKSVTLTNSTMQFESEPLPVVLDKLNDYYSTQIIYNKAEVDTISFTGTITKTDSLNIILKVIAQMNGLNVHQQNDTLFIQKPKQ